MQRQVMCGVYLPRRLHAVHGREAHIVWQDDHKELWFDLRCLRLDGEVQGLLQGAQRPKQVGLMCQEKMFHLRCVSPCPSHAEKEMFASLYVSSGESADVFNLLPCPHMFGCFPHVPRAHVNVKGSLFGNDWLFHVICGILKPMWQFRQCAKQRMR